MRKIRCADLLKTYCILFVEYWYSFSMFLLRTFPFRSCVYNVKVVWFFLFPLEYSLLSCCHIILKVAILWMREFMLSVHSNFREIIDRKSKMTAKMKVLFFWVWNTIIIVVTIIIESIGGTFPVQYANNHKSCPLVHRLSEKKPVHTVRHFS